MSDSRYRANPARLTAKQLDYVCQGLGPICVICGNRLDESPRICPSISDVDLVHEIAREMHTAGGRR